jgi:hypothetical protein
MTAFGWVVTGCALAKVAIHLATATGYGFFCDELYHIALSKHLAWGYVDLPPLTPALVALGRAVLGESLFANHVPPALAGAGTLVLVCLVTRELGGKAFAAAVAGLAFLAAPVWLILDSFFCYDSLDQLALAGFTFVLARLLRTGDRRLWILAGAVAGVACLAKLTILFLGPGLLVALLLSERRRDLLTPWPWLGLLAFLALIAPYLHWQATNGWPTVAFWGRYQSGHVYRASALEYLVSIALIVNPLSFPLLLLGLYRIFRPFGGTSFRLLGGTVVLGMATILAAHGRAFMLSQLFVPLIAAAAVWLEEQLARLPRPTLAQGAVAAYLVAGLVLVAPASVPILPTRLLPAYARSFGWLYQPVKDFTYQKNEYPQELANRIGWEELVEQVARSYRELPPQDQARAGIWADWVGPAGAIDLYGPRYGLPRAVSGHMNYHRWGPGENGWQVMILVTSNISQLGRMFRVVEDEGAIENPYALPFNRLRVYVAREPLVYPTAMWRQMGPY